MSRLFFDLRSGVFSSYPPSNKIDALVLALRSRSFTDIEVNFVLLPSLDYMRVRPII